MALPVPVAKALSMRALFVMEPNGYGSNGCCGPKTVGGELMILAWPGRWHMVELAVAVHGVIGPAVPLRRLGPNRSSPRLRPLRVVRRMWFS